jgi:HPt (histidine-containing phosphotransfer) domain-containing protein
MAGLLNLEALDALRALEEPGSADFLTEIITTYVSDGEGRFKALHAAWAARDAAEVAAISHTLKGGSLNVGAESLACMMQEIEKKAKAGTLCGKADLSAAESLFLRVAQALAAYLG